MEFLDEMARFVSMVADGQATTLILLGDGGLGKSFTVVKTLARKELVPDRDYVCINSYATPLEFYNLVYKHNDKKVIVCDDCEGLLSNKRGQSILKSMTWAPDGERITSYATTSGARKAPDRYVVKPRFILCLNEIPKDPVFRAMATRCIIYRVDLTYEQKVQLLREIGVTNNIDIEIVEFIISNLGRISNNLNIRTLIKAKQVYDYDREHWKDMVLELLKPDSVANLISQLNCSQIPVEEQARAFMEKTGMARSSFFNYRKKLGITGGL